MRNSNSEFLYIKISFMKILCLFQHVLYFCQLINIKLYTNNRERCEIYVIFYSTRSVPVTLNSFISPIYMLPARVVSFQKKGILLTFLTIYGIQVLNTFTFLNFI